MHFVTTTCTEYGTTLLAVTGRVNVLSLWHVGKDSFQAPALCKKNPGTIHQVTTMLATFKNVLFPGHNHLLTTDTDSRSLAGAQAIIKVKGYHLAGGHDQETEHF